MNLKIKEVQSLLNEGVEAEFAELGFKYRKTLFQYVKENKDIYNIYRINLLKKTDWFNVVPEVFLAIPKINKIYSQAFGVKIKSSDTTFGFAIRNEFRTRGSYIIDCDSDIVKAIEKIKADFYEIAIPFFQENQSLKDVDKMINMDKKLGNPTVCGACDRLILAKLCDNPEYEKLADEYYEYCKNAQGKLAAPILEIKKFLDENF